MIESLDLPPLPEGWVWTRLGEIVSEIERGNPKDTPERDFIYLDIASIDNSQQKITNPKKYFGKNAPSRARQIVKSGDILFSTVRTYLKNIAIVNDIYDGQIASTGFCVIRPYDLINQRLIFYLVQTDFFLNPLTQIQRGTSYPAVRDSDVFAQFIPIPPLSEQHRLVAKVEELFTKLDAGVKSLEKTKAQLKRYRQAVLKYAFEGKLTEEWRETHREIVEPASELLRNTLEEKAKQKNKKTKSFPQMGGSELRPLLDEWLSLTLDYLASSEKNSIKRGPFGSSIKKEFFVPSGYKVYEQKNVIYNDFERGDYFVDEKKFEELKDFEVKSGDVLMSCSGTVGKIAIAPEGIQPGIINQALLKIRLDNDIVSTSVAFPNYHINKYSTPPHQESRPFYISI